MYIETIYIIYIIYTLLINIYMIDVSPADIMSEEDLIGKPWTYRLEIKSAADLPGI